jgi:hypothetical protein
MLRIYAFSIDATVPFISISIRLGKSKSPLEGGQVSSDRAGGFVTAGFSKGPNRT